MLQSVSPFSKQYPGVSEQIAAHVNRNAHPEKSLLSKAEADSIKDYTGEAFKKTNPTLRDGTLELAPGLHESIRHMDSGIKKLAAENVSVQKTFRGVKQLPPNFRQDHVFTDPAYLSTSRGDTAASRMWVRKFTNDGGAAVIFGKSGADLAKHKATLMAHEREILYPRGTEFNVLFHSPMPEAARSLVKSGSPISPKASSVSVLEERGLPPIDLKRARAQRLESDISPAIAPVEKNRLRDAAAAMNADPARTRAQQLEPDLSTAVTAKQLEAAKAALQANPFHY